jgi:hypothetical protein
VPRRDDLSHGRRARRDDDRSGGGPVGGVRGEGSDYALNDDILHVAMIDAMGHGLSAAVSRSTTSAAKSSVSPGSWTSSSSAASTAAPFRKPCDDCPHSLKLERGGITSDDATLLLLEWRGGTADYLAIADEPLTRYSA